MPITALEDIEKMIKDLKENGYVSYIHNESVPYDIRRKRECFSHGLPEMVLNLISMIKDLQNESAKKTDLL